MGSNTCPYCKEEIKAEAIICKHCHTKLHYTPAERLLAAIQYRLGYAHAPGITIGPISPCKAACYGRQLSGAQLQECLDNCDAIEYLAIVAERLVKELNETIIDVVWKKGDIDPLPFEKLVRERFSRPS